MRSPFRPDAVPDAAILDDHKPLIHSLERRGLIRGGLSLGALVMLTGCDVKRPEAVESALLAISRFNDDVQALLFDPNKLAPTYPASMILQPPKFNAYYDVMDVKPVNGAAWRLELFGLIADKRPWTLQQLQALPQSSMVIKHICVEGWSYIGGWSGVPLRVFLERVGADLRAKYVAFKTADDYPSSIDMATALHPQTLLATQYGGDTLADPFGYPVRLRMATKTWIQKPKVDHSHRGDEHLSWRILGNERLSMVCGHMKRTTPICILLASCLLTATASVAHAQSTTPGGAPPPPGMSLAESAAMRFPQPVRVGDLLGREVLRPVESQDVLGRVRRLVRGGNGQIMVVVDFGGFLGFGTRPIAVPVDAMVLLGQDMEIVAFTPKQLRQFPTFSPSGATDVARYDYQIGPGQTLALTVRWWLSSLAVIKPSLLKERGL